MVFFLSIGEGYQVYLIYVFAVLLSVIYFDEMFTLKIEVLSIFLMLISFTLRKKIISTDYIETTLSEWNLVHSTNAIFEYIIFGITCFFIANVIRRVLTSVYNHKKGLQSIQEQIALGFANIIEAKDECTGEHIKRTSEYVWLICLKLRQNNIYPQDVTPESSVLMIRAAPFHDIGKISIPDSILNKKGPLTPEEFEIMRLHPIDGAEFIVKKMNLVEDKALIEVARDMALCHHEHMDGTGYPNRLIGEEIPVSARIMAIADILDALLSERSYKPAYSLEKSFGIIKEMSKDALDPTIVQVLLECGEEVKVIRDGGKK